MFLMLIASELYQRNLWETMSKSENCKFRAEILKAGEVASNEDAAGKPEKFATKIRNLRLKYSFSETLKCF